MVDDSPSMSISKRRGCTRPLGRGSPTKKPPTYTSAGKYTSNFVHNKLTPKKKCIGDSSCQDQASFLALHQTFSSLTDKQYGAIVEDDDATRATMDGSLERIGTIAVLYQTNSCDHECQHTSTRRSKLNERVEIFFVPHPYLSLFCPSSESSEECDLPPDANRDQPQPLPSPQSRPQPRPQPRPQLRPRSTKTSPRFIKNSICASRRPTLHKKGRVSLNHGTTKKQGQILPKATKWEKLDTVTRPNGVPWEIVIKDFECERENRSERYSQSNERDAAPSLQIQDRLRNSSTIDPTKGKTIKTKTRLDVQQNQRKAYIKSRVKSLLKSSKDLPEPRTLRQVINNHPATFRNQKTLAQGTSRNIKTKTIEKRNSLSHLKDEDKAKAKAESKSKAKSKAKSKIKQKVSKHSIVEIIKKAYTTGYRQTPKLMTQLNNPHMSHQMPSTTNSGSTNDLSRSNIYSQTGQIRRSGESATQFRSPAPSNDTKSNIQIGHKADHCRFRPRSSSVSNKEGIARRLATNKSQKKTTKIKTEYGRSRSSNQACFKHNDHGMNTRINSFINTKKKLNEEVSSDPRQSAKRDIPRLPWLVKKKVKFLKPGSKLPPIAEDVPC